MGKFKVGFYIGRFQPVHKGHIHAITYALGKVEELIIGIGSAQFSHEIENPFTAGERFSMLKLGLDENGVDRKAYWIIPIPDTRVHSLWVAQVVSYSPRFDVAFTNDPLSSELLREAGFVVEGIPYLNREIYNATNVRERILNGESWETLVPQSVADFIKKIRGVERIRDLAKTDNPHKPKKLKNKDYLHTDFCI
ncbi:nicotinamide-nucleotide adenylyltransferase [Candidatus Bathyarchaeota archaeon]|nr:MAG: nicotinamide-nucleotide adenylyltransferase [Candidatus Bathyarchaeota archaeon]